MDTSRITELKTALAERLTVINDGMTNGVKVDGANVEVSTETAVAIQTAMRDAQEIKGLIDAEAFGTEVKSWMDQPTTQSVALDSPSMKMLRKDIGSAFTDSAEFKALIQSGGSTMSSPFEIEVYDLPSRGQRKDVYADLASRSITTGVGGVVQFDAPVPRPFRQLRVRDLFPVATTNANLIDFFRVMGFSTGDPGAAASVPDRDGSAFGLKPKSTLTWESDQAPVRTIAHWEAAHRNVLDDVPQLQATINNELLYGLQLEEDRQILSGSGANDELKGLLNTTGIQTYAQDATEQKSDALRRAATKAIIANYAPTGYVLHPYDWEDIELQKGSGDGQYMLVTNISIGAAAQVWRQPVVETPAIDEGTFLTGAFGLGAQIYDRQQANIRIAEQHADFFVRNAVAILAEERIAMAVKRPESFVKGTFSDAPAS